MSSGRDRDKLALIHVQGNEIAPTSNENNEAITNTFLSVLGVQENKGIFEQISNEFFFYWSKVNSLIFCFSTSFQLKGCHWHTTCIVGTRHSSWTYNYSSYVMHSSLLTANLKV